MPLSDNFRKPPHVKEYKEGSYMLSLEKSHFLHRDLRVTVSRDGVAQGHADITLSAK